MTYFRLSVICIGLLGLSATACSSASTPDASGAGGDGGAAGGSGGTAGGMSGGGGWPAGGSTATGGSAMGGSSSGGTGAVGGEAGAGGSAGSSGSAGSAGSAGSGGSAGSTPGPTGSECNSAGTCTLHSDCCNCLALAPGETAPTCTETCIQDKCSELGITQPSCTAGRCSAGIDCDHSKVMCKAPTPNCGPGDVASVVGSCWGPCVQAEQCKSVSSCTACPTKTLCVQNEGLTKSLHCVPTISSCSPLSCGCASDLVCTPPFSTCKSGGPSTVDGPDITCTCPSC